MQQVIKQNLFRAQACMKRQADKNRSERSFDVGDWVFLNLQPYVQSSLAHRSHQKLAFRFFGPYQVLERVGSVAYRLALPSCSAIHPVFHVSQLKHSHGKAPVSPSLPADVVEFQVPEVVLQRRWSSGPHPVQQVLIKWSHMPASLATWESLEQLQAQFPRAPAWGHAGLQERGNVSPNLTVADPATGGSMSAEGTQAVVRPKRVGRPNTRVIGPERK